MKKFVFPAIALFAGAGFLASSALAQYETPPASAADKEAAYTAAIEKRTEDIVVLLVLSDAAKSNKVHDIIIAQYRALRARDDAMAAKTKEASKEAAARDVQNQTKTLHDQFLTKLSAELTPEQVEKVKDKMTYNKVMVTYDAYCAIVPGLADKEKIKIMELLKEAREEAIDGGSASEKSAIFQKYKDKINDYLNAQGHDVAKAYKEWNAKQELAQKQRDESAPKAVQQAQ